MSDFCRSVYDRGPVWLQNLMVSIYGYRLRAIRYGGGHRRYLAELEESQWLPAAEIRRLQWERLHAVVRYACENTDFYAERASGVGFDVSKMRSVEDLQILPTLRREDIRQHGDRMIDRTFAKSRLIKQYTSGTSGSPLRLYLTKETWERNYAFWARFRSWFGFRVGQRRATLAGRIVVPQRQRTPPFWRYNSVDHQLLFSSFHQSAQTHAHYARKMSLFAPALIDGYVSSIHALASYINRQGIETIRPRAVQTTSETLLPAHRTEIETAFKCRVFNQYGHGENAVFISECDHGGLHVNDEYGVVEILVGDRPAKPGEVGEIVVTGFNNRAMPLIRYRTTDLAVCSDPRERCGCGRGLSLVEGLEGRIVDVIRLPDGSLIPPTALTLLFDKAHALGIEESQIVQTAHDKIVVKLVPNGPSAVLDTAPLEEDLRLIVGDGVDVCFETVVSIPRSESGKAKFVVSEVVR